MYIIVLLCFYKTLEYMRVTATFATSYYLLGTIIKKVLVNFGMIYVVFMLGFSIIFYGLRAHEDPVCGRSLLSCTVWTFQAGMLGSIAVEGGPERFNFLWQVIFVIFVSFMAVIMMNLLIAFMTEGFEEVQRTAGARWCFKQFKALETQDQDGLDVLPTYIWNCYRKFVAFIESGRGDRCRLRTIYRQQCMLWRCGRACCTSFCGCMRCRRTDTKIYREQINPEKPNEVFL